MSAPISRKLVDGHDGPYIVEGNDCWCHRATGSRYCDLSEQTVAQPLLAA